MKRISYTILFLINFLLLTNYGFTQNLANSSKIHLEKGKSFLVSGHTNEAIEEFSKTLLKDKKNEEAISHLKSISEKGDISSKRKANLYLWESLVNHIDELRAQSNYFIIKREHLIKKLMKIGYHRSTFIKELKNLQVSDATERYIKSSKNKNFTSEEPNNLIELIDIFTDEKEKLSRKLDNVKKQFDFLKQFHKNNPEIKKTLVFKTIVSKEMILLIK